MDEAHKELVQRLRASAGHQARGGGWADPCKVTDTLNWNAADALEALVAERDRLKAAMAVIADMLSRRLDGNRRWDLKSIYDIAREALEAKE